MLFINLWNLARCDVVKGGFQPARLRRAKLPHWRGFLPTAAKAAWVGMGRAKELRLANRGVPCLCWRPYSSAALLIFPHIWWFNRCLLRAYSVPGTRWAGEGSGGKGGTISHAVGARYLSGCEEGCQCTPPRYHPFYACVPTWSVDASWPPSPVKSRGASVSPLLSVKLFWNYSKNFLKILKIIAYKVGSMKVFLFVYLHFMCMHVCLHVCMFTMSKRGQKRASYPPEVES